MKTSSFFLTTAILVLATSVSLARGRSSSGGGSGGFHFHVGYDQMTVNPTKMNEARENLLWNTTTPSGGKFNQLTSTSVEVGFRALGPGFFFLQYNTGTQTLANTTVFGTPTTVEDSFKYDSLYLIYDYPVAAGNWMLMFGGGVGTTQKFELHQKVGGGGSINEDITWKGSAMPFKLRATLGYPLFSSVNIFLRAQYESVSAKLKAAQAYQSQINGQPITSGQEFQNFTPGTSAPADLSGLRLGLGLAFVF